VNIVSASRRTDIPAFHADWLMHRVRHGSVKVRSPYGGRLYEVSLAPENVISIVFWTKNAGPLLPFLDELRDAGHCFTFLYTINNYPTFLEPAVPKWSQTMRVVERLHKRFSSSVFRWRYDTIVMTERTDRLWHLNNFSMLCKSLAPYTKECIFSFCDYYRKTVRNMSRYAADYHEPLPVQCSELAEEMALLAAGRGISLRSCADDSLVSENIGKAHCIDADHLSRVVDSDERKEALNGLKKLPTRKECGCTESKDIGAYDTCPHGCVYCYANANPDSARRNLGLIAPNGSCLDPRAKEVPSG
jgi:Domain of unknown function (DUF1848)